MTCPTCKHSRAKRFGTYGRKRVQRYRCLSCKATFNETREGRFGRHYLTMEQTGRVVSLMLEGVSIRAIERRSIEAFQMQHEDHVIEVCGLVFNDFHRGNVKSENRIARKDVLDNAKKYGWYCRSA